MGDEPPNGDGGNKCEHHQVFYDTRNSNIDKQASIILEWLNRPNIPRFSKHGTQNAEVILVFDYEGGRASDDILAFTGKYKENIQIIILALVLYDEKNHEQHCTHTIIDKENITYLELHRRDQGYIHECAGNKICKDTVNSKLTPFENQSETGTEGKPKALNLKEAARSENGSFAYILAIIVILSAIFFFVSLVALSWLYVRTLDGFVNYLNCLHHLNGMTKTDQRNSHQPHIIHHVNAF